MSIRRSGFRNKMKLEAMAGDQRKGGRRGTPTPNADVPIGLFQLGIWDARENITSPEPMVLV